MTNMEFSTQSPAVACIGIGALFLGLSVGVHILGGRIELAGVLFVLLGAFLAIVNGRT